MNKLKASTLLIALLAALLIPLVGRAEEASSLEAEKEETMAEIDMGRLSEAIGHMFGRYLEALTSELDLEAVNRGLREGFLGKESPMSEEEYLEALQLVQEAAFQRRAAENLAEAEAFLEENAATAGILTLEEGKLQYSVDQQGTGAVVTLNDSPVIHYTGRYMDGTVFGSSLEDNPISLPLRQTISGFSLGIAGMQEGEKRTLYIHPELGYGTSGQLLPNSLLVFEVEVLQANPDKQGDDVDHLQAEATHQEERLESTLPQA